MQWGLEVWTQKPEFISQLCHFLCDAGTPLYVSFLCLSVLICKMRVKAVPAS